MHISKVKNSVIILLPAFIVIFVIGLSSCKSERRLDTGEARIKGRIVNPARNFIELKQGTSSGGSKDTAMLNDKGEFEIILRPDTLSLYSFEYGSETGRDTLTTNEESENLIVSNNKRELTLMLEKGFDLKLWVDTRDPSSSLSISGNGAEINNYTARKVMLSSEFNMHNARLLKSTPGEYVKFINEYKANLDKLISGLPSKSSNLPEGYRESEAKNNYLTISRLKLIYAKEHLADEGKDPELLQDDPYFDFLKEIPLDKPEEFSNPEYMRYVSAYADYLTKNENPGLKLTGEQEAGAKYEVYKRLFKDPATRDRVLFDFLKKNRDQIDRDWYKEAVEEFRNTASSDSLKKELTGNKETGE